MLQILESLVRETHTISTGLWRGMAEVVGFRQLMIPLEVTGTLPSHVDYRPGRIALSWPS